MHSKSVADLIVSTLKFRPQLPRRYAVLVEGRRHWHDFDVKYEEEKHNSHVYLLSLDSTHEIAESQVQNGDFAPVFADRFTDEAAKICIATAEILIDDDWAAVLAMACKYFEVLLKKGAAGDWKMFMVCVLLADKFLRDDYNSNDSYAFMMFVGLEEVNQLEHTVLAALDFQLWR
eukprot:TRINITY_DN2424_c0_g1_i5.p1 TRINITY_DN2424_c0_g1~~TRINITY_DN2424_c0_g1_i5.p1  ORF type:complete len:175 (+),score=48.79 TRINITY_DN2424_c0_g1_i5:292-816(+)